MANWNAVDWAQVGEALAMGAGAFIAAFMGAKRVWKKGLGELLRPAINREVSAAVRSALRSMRMEVVASVTEQVREAMHEELAPMREELDEIAERLARTEGAVAVLSSNGTHPKEDATTK